MDKRIVTADGTEFEISYGGPVSITENVVFLVRIVNSDIDSVHNCFKLPEKTETLTIYLTEADEGTVYTGYTRYCGFDVDGDSGITVTLKKNLGA